MRNDPADFPPTNGPKRITSLRIQGYRPFGDFLARLGPLEVIVGANASGKSSLFEFLKFLRDSSLQEFPPEIVAKNPVDRDRIYLTGLSMGGHGSWLNVAAHPDRFAAMAPVCGGGDPREADLVKDVPIWVFHGAKDTTVPIRESYEMVEALRKVHGRVRFTVYPEAGHNSWDQAYSTDELYAWMLRQVRNKPDQPPATMPGTAPSE